MAEEASDELCNLMRKIMETALDDTSIVTAEICGNLKTAVLKDVEVPELSLGEQMAAVEWWRWILILGLVMLSGCFSGLNLGVLGLDTKDLEMLTEGPYETKED